MRAVELQGEGGVEQLQLRELPDPVAAPGNVLVKLHAAALNHRDLWIRKGQYPGLRLPCVLGSDGAGDVVDVGEGVDANLRGQPVVIHPSLAWGGNPAAQGKEFRILGMPDQGTYAELIAVPVENVYPKPPHLDMISAAALPLAGLTAYRALTTRAQVQPGETVLVTGIGGGVSTFALQMALALGARVFVTSSSPNKLAKAQELGATGGVNYRDPDWGKQLVDLAGGQGPDVIIDGAGGASLLTVIQIAKVGARIANYGSTAGPLPELVLGRLFLKQISLLGTTMGNNQEFASMLRLYTEHRLQPVIDTVLPLEQYAAAQEHMAESNQMGKIVMTMRGNHTSTA